MYVKAKEMHAVKDVNKCSNAIKECHSQDSHSGNTFIYRICDVNEWKHCCPVYEDLFALSVSILK